MICRLQKLIFQLLYKQAGSKMIISRKYEEK
jgi:hypothetical protein